MLLKTDRIADLLDAGANDLSADPFVITPTPDLKEIRESGSAAVDLRLGTWFSNLREARVPCLRVDDPAPVRQVARTSYVPFGGEYILHPGGFVLAVTLEWVRLPSNLAAYVVGKSSWGRWGLIIATATGVHPGFKGCLTLELSNVGEIPIAVKPGIRICQLFLHELRTDSDATDPSAFVGMRKPAFRRIKLDPLGALLARAAQMP